MSTLYRLLGVVPILFYLNHLVYHLAHGQAGNMLWMCHLSNLFLAAGMLFDLRPLVRIAALWLAIGLPLWVDEMGRTGEFTWTSLATHAGGLALALWALHTARCDRWSWVWAWLAFIGAQLLARLFTPEALNVNLAFTAREGLHAAIPNFGAAWLVMQAAIGTMLGLTQWILYWLFPPLRPASSATALAEQEVNDAASATHHEG